MKLTLLALLVLIPAASAGVWPGRWRWPMFHGWGPSHYGNKGPSRYGNNHGGHCSCTSPRIPLEDKLALIARNNDHNDDAIIDTDDINYDVSERYDKNKDNIWTESECIEGFKCLYGDSDFVAQYICAVLLQGEAALPNYKTVFSNPPFDVGIPRDQFIQMNRQRYETFFNKRCVNRALTVEEKLTLNAAYNDFNNDGLVTSQDLEYDLTNKYDTDKNGEMSKAEWVATFVCLYGDSGDYARYMWDQIIGEAQAVPNNYFSGPPFDTGVPIEDFKANNRQNYENFRNKDASSYIQPHN